MKGELLRKTMSKVAESVDKKLRSIHMIYCNLWSQDILFEVGFRIERKLRDYAVVFTIDY